MNFGPGVPATLVKDGGHVASPTGAAGEGPGRSMIMAAPTTENLNRLAQLLADGTLSLPVQATYDLAQGPEALTALATTHTQGKLAIRNSRARRAPGGTVGAELLKRRTT